MMVSVLGALPGLATSRGRASCDLLEGQVLAYGTAASVTVVDVYSMQVVCVLSGAHHGATVTSVKWCHARPSKLALLHLYMQRNNQHCSSRMQVP